MNEAQFTIDWRLRQLMAERGIFKTTALMPLLTERGIQLSREQVYRLVAHTPARLNLEVLAALCLILECTPSDLIEVQEGAAATLPSTGTGGPSARLGDLEPVRARISRPGQ